MRGIYKDTERLTYDINGATVTVDYDGNVISSSDTEAHPVGSTITIPASDLQSHVSNQSLVTHIGKINPIDEFAMCAFKAILSSMTSPEAATSSEMSDISAAAYEWADAMMNAAINYRNNE